MGMHFGLLTVACDMETFLAAVRSLAGELLEVNPPADDEDEDDEGGDLDVCEHNGRSWVTDRAFDLVSAPDFLVALSTKVPDPVIAYYAETVSGSYGLVVARDGKLRRLYHNCHSTLSHPLSIGEPYPFDDQLESIDGEGAIALLQHYGLTSDEEPDEAIRRFDFEPRQDLKSGTLGAAIVAHEVQYAIRPDRRPPIGVTGRVLRNDDRERDCKPR
jgi:hypothetical protein